jgi:short-subunit dehydrogenase
MASLTLNKLAKLSALAMGATLVGRALMPRAHRYRLTGKNALVTGGGRGLGLEIARQLVSKGANVAIVARDESEIARALADLRQCLDSASVQVIGQICDLQDAAAIDDMLAAVRRDLGPIDVLVNNAGMIQVGPLDSMTFSDFEQAMQLHCFAPLRTMLGVRADMRARGAGRIVNVASIGGIVAVPHLLPYSASKFALMGLSQGMGAELAADGIVVSTVAPGLMRTGSPRLASFKGDNEKEYAWFTLSDSLPFMSVSSRRAARRIVRSIELGEPYVVIGAPAKLAVALSGLAPGLVSRALSFANVLLPSGANQRSRRGFESESKLTRSAVTTLTKRAAAANNEC